MGHCRINYDGTQSFITWFDGLCRIVISWLKLAMFELSNQYSEGLILNTIMKMFINLSFIVLSLKIPESRQT